MGIAKCKCEIPGGPGFRSCRAGARLGFAFGEDLHMGVRVKSLTEEEYEHVVAWVGGGGGLAGTAEPGWRDRCTVGQWRQRCRDLLMVLFLGDAGLRVGEVRLLDHEDMVCGGALVRSVHVRACVGKGGYARMVPLTSRLQGAVAGLLACGPGRGDWKADDAVCGMGRLWSRLTTRRIQQIVGDAGQFVLGRRITPHQLRHTFAVRLRRRVDLPTVQALLGHRSLSSTQVYMNVCDEDLRRAVDSLSEPVGRSPLIV